MTINSETRVAGPFDGNDSTVSFPFTFKVFDSDEVRVVAETGAVETDLELGTDYTVVLNADQNAAPGGSVVLAAPLATGTRLTLTSALEMLQPVELTNQGGFPPRVINSALDRLTILLQQLASVVSRTLKFPLSDGPVGDLPGRSVRAGTVLAFDEATGEPVAGPDISSVNGVVGALVAINTVAGNIADVNTVADNITDLSNFSGVYYGPSATDPTTRRDGSPLQVGDLYFNTVVNTLRTYNGSVWRESVTGAVTVQNLSGNGVETEFLLDYAPESEVITNVFIGGVYQQKNTYELGGANGDVLIFGEAPPAGTDNIEVVVSSLIPSDNKLRQDLASPAGASMIGRGAQVVHSISALRSLLKTSPSKSAFVTGYHAAGDGGGGAYYLDAADTTSADNGGTVIVAADGGRWKLVFDSLLSIAQFGVTSWSFGDISAVLSTISRILYEHNGGGIIRLGALSYQLSDEVSIYPEVEIIGVGTDKTRIEFSATNKAAFKVFKPVDYVPELVFRPNLKQLTINCVNGKTSGCSGFDVTNAKGSEIQDVVFANFTNGLIFNGKGAGTPFLGQVYHCRVQQCHFASCANGVAFAGATNRNTFETNTYTSCDVAFNFSAPNNVSETNVFINENVEGCHAWAEWPLGQIFAQTWIGLTIENPITNGYVCTVKDPGRQLFVNLGLIPSAKAEAVDFYRIRTDWSSLLGSLPSSEGLSYGFRVAEEVHLYRGLRNGAWYGSAVYSTAGLLAGASATINIAVTGATVGDLVKASADKDLLGCVLSGWVSATNTVTVRIQNASAGNVPLSNVTIRAVVEKFI